MPTKRSRARVRGAGLSLIVATLASCMAYAPGNNLLASVSVIENRFCQMVPACAKRGVARLSIDYASGKKTRCGVGLINKRTGITSRHCFVNPTTTVNDSRCTANATSCVAKLLLGDDKDLRLRRIITSEKIDAALVEFDEDAPSWMDYEGLNYSIPELLVLVGPNTFNRIVPQTCEPTTVGAQSLRDGIQCTSSEGFSGSPITDNKNIFHGLLKGLQNNKNETAWIRSADAFADFKLEQRWAPPLVSDSSSGNLTSSPHDKLIECKHTTVGRSYMCQNGSCERPLPGELSCKKLTNEYDSLPVKIEHRISEKSTISMLVSGIDSDAMTRIIDSAESACFNGQLGASFEGPCACGAADVEISWDRLFLWKGPIYMPWRPSLHEIRIVRTPVNDPASLAAKERAWLGGGGPLNITADDTSEWTAVFVRGIRKDEIVNCSDLDDVARVRIQPRKTDEVLCYESEVLLGHGDAKCAVEKNRIP